MGRKKKEVVVDNELSILVRLDASLKARMQHQCERMFISMNTFVKMGIVKLCTEMEKEELQDRKEFMDLERAIKGPAKHNLRKRGDK